MATTKTTQLADAISILSSVLSTEVAEGNHFLEDDDIEVVSAEDHEELQEAATDFISTQLVDLESVQSDLQELVTDITPSESLWDDDDEDERTEEFFDDITRVLVPVWIALFWQWAKEQKEFEDEDNRPGFLELPDYITYQF